MRAAVRRLARGESARLSPDLQVHLVAARYGQPLDAVREWPADDFLTAIALWSISGGPPGRSHG